MECITLSDLLPDVFLTSECAASLDMSQVWRHEVVFHRGSVYMISAASGTGKSSLLSFIYGNRNDYSGTIRFDGSDIRTLSASDWSRIRCRSLALLPQEMRLFPELTVMENIEIKNELTHHKTVHEIRSMLMSLEIEHKADIPVGRLSIGQQQRVALVRTLCQPADFILLDEPVSHLDSVNNAVVADLVAREAALSGAGIIVTSVGYDMALERYTKIVL